MTSTKPKRLPTILADARRNPFFALGAFGLSGWAYVGMSHTIADYEGEVLGYALGVAYEALVIGLAWEGRRRADQCLDAGRPVKGHWRWLIGAIAVGILSGAWSAYHGWTLSEGWFAASRAVAPILAAIAVHLFFQSAASSRDLERKEQIREDRESAVLDMLDAVRLAQIAPIAERAARIAEVNVAVGRVHRNVPAAVTAEVTAPHLESERTIHDVIREAAALAGKWMPEPELATTPLEHLPTSQDMTHDTTAVGPVVIERGAETHEGDADASDTVRAERDTLVRVAAAGDDTSTRVTARTRVSSLATPAGAVTPPDGVDDGLYGPMPDHATPKDRAERARALAQALGTADESGGLRVSTAVADAIADVVGRKRRQVYRYLAGENNDSTDTGSVPVVTRLDLDQDAHHDSTASYAEAAMLAGR
ncbi:hypothetical protein [Antribacter gilvus]|uniref:hypothetical protein n=1 Tax=Antribacter gilvus TaxID=2304675 RepID=UPI000F794575|nr:hypothetical protein [Antribacter gilvus]